MVMLVDVSLALPDLVQTGVLNKLVRLCRMKPPFVGHIMKGVPDT